jgi:acetyl-CoA carboxylase carboxyltransferase component
MILSFKTKSSKSQRVNEGVGEKRQVLVNNEGQMSQRERICLFLAIGSRLRLEVDSVLVQGFALKALGPRGQALVI